MLLGFQDGDYTGLHTVARSLVNLQSSYGMIPNVYGQGSAAKIVDELTNTLLKELEERRSPINHQIGHLVLIDRNIDYVTPMCSQVSYTNNYYTIYQLYRNNIDILVVKSFFMLIFPIVGSLDENLKMQFSNEFYQWDHFWVCSLACWYSRLHTPQLCYFGQFAVSCGG